MDDAALHRMMAMQALLEQLVRLLMRERAIANGEGPADVLEYAEVVKRYFEDRVREFEAEALITAAVDRFFNVLASDLRDQTGTP